MGDKDEEMSRKSGVTTAAREIRAGKRRCEVAKDRITVSSAPLSLLHGTFWAQHLSRRPHPSSKARPRGRDFAGSKKGKDKNGC